MSVNDIDSEKRDLSKPNERYLVVAIALTFLAGAFGPDYYRNKKYTLIAIALPAVILLYLIIGAQNLGNDEENLHKLSKIDFFATFVSPLFVTALGIFLAIKSKNSYAPKALGKLFLRALRKLGIFLASTLPVILTLVLSEFSEHKFHFFETATAEINGNSMFPTLIDGDRVTVHSSIDTITKGEIYLFEHDGSTMVKRLVGFAGDTISVENGRITRNRKKMQYIPIEKPLTINGITLLPDKNWQYFYEVDEFANINLVRLPPVTDTEDRTYFEITVKDDHVFMIGDNRLNSLDSRQFGTINEMLITEKAIGIMWSYSDQLGFLRNRMFSNITVHKETN